MKNNKRIVIKPADKGSSTVIINLADYLKEGYSQLLNESFHEKLEAPIYPRVFYDFHSLLQDIHANGYIDRKQFDYLRVGDFPKDRTFYMLPKIHKDVEKWTNDVPPGRPIVSDCDSDTYRISEYIDTFLAPLANQHKSYLQDTQD